MTGIGSVCGCGLKQLSCKACCHNVGELCGCDLKQLSCEACDHNYYPRELCGCDLKLPSCEACNHYYYPCGCDLKQLSCKACNHNYNPGRNHLSQSTLGGLARLLAAARQHNNGDTPMLKVEPSNAAPRSSPEEQARIRDRIMRSVSIHRGSAGHKSKRQRRI